MDNKELQNIIDRLESENKKEEAYFGIFEFGGGSDESFIRANKQGLEIFAADLLKASRDAEDLSKDEKAVFLLDHEEEWIDEESRTFIHYIEPSLHQRENARIKPHIQTWKEKALQRGCAILVILLIVSSVVGIMTIFKWIVS